MFGRRFELFRLFGFPIRIDVSWILIVVLITWSLAEAVYPRMFDGLSTTIYWIMGFCAAIGLFASVLLHELGHALVARRYGLEMRGITLFIFGGVAEMDTEPPSANAELAVAVGGPIVSVILSAVFFGVWQLGELGRAPVAVQGITWHLGLLNAVVVGFNLIPAFPLDGGRVLRAGLWSWRRDLKWATKITARIGGTFGIVLIVLGIFLLLTGNLLGGIWWVLIGLFLRGAAQMSYQQVLMRRALEGEPVRRFMKQEPVTVGSDISVQRLVDDYFLTHHYKMFPVSDNGDLKGCVTTASVRDIPRDQWGDTDVGDVLQSCTDDNTISADADAMDAMSKMNRTGSSRLLVTEGDRLIGIISLKDLLGFLSRKVELDEPEENPFE